MMISKRFDVYHNAFTEHSKRGLGAAGLQILLAFQAQTGQLLLEHTANKVLEKVPSWWLVHISSEDLHVYVD